MARIVAMTWVSSALKIWTMWRSDIESASLKTYVPGCSTVCGSWIVSLTVRVVFLFQSSARSDAVKDRPNSAVAEMTAAFSEIIQTSSDSGWLRKKTRQAD